MLLRWVFSRVPMRNFTIMKSYFKFRFYLTNIRIASKCFAFKEVNYLLRITVNWPNLTFRYFTTGFDRKSICITYKVRKLTVTFSTWFRLSGLFNTWQHLVTLKNKMYFRVLPLQNPRTGISLKMFLCSWSGINRIYHSCKTFLTFWKVR